VALGVPQLTGALSPDFSQSTAHHRRLKQFGAFFFAMTLLLAGCAGAGGAMVETTQLWLQQLQPGAASDGLPKQPDPRFRYLRVEMPGRSPALWVLAYVDEHPMGDIEVWFSALSQVIKLQNGRIVGTHGLAVDWTAVRFDAAPPQWSTLTASQSSPVVVYERDHDEIPSYRFGVREQLVLQAAAQVPPLQLHGLRVADGAGHYAWFKETAVPQGTQNGATLTNWYAWGLHLGQQRVVYSEQCLKPDFCVRMQRWPVQEGAT